MELNIHSWSGPTRVGAYEIGGFFQKPITIIVVLHCNIYLIILTFLCRALYFMLQICINKTSCRLICVCVFVCTFLGVSVCRDRLLPRWIKIISKTRVTTSMYEEQSFLRDPALLQFVIQVLESLKDFEIVLEASLIRGVNLWPSHSVFSVPAPLGC